MTKDHSVTKHADDDGNFRRQQSTFRSTISKDGEFPPEKGRYSEAWLKPNLLKSQTKLTFGCTHSLIHCSDLSLGNESRFCSLAKGTRGHDWREHHMVLCLAFPLPYYKCWRSPLFRLQFLTTSLHPKDGHSVRGQRKQQVIQYMAKSTFVISSESECFPPVALHKLTASSISNVNKSSHVHNPDYNLRYTVPLLFDKVSQISSL